MRISLEVEKLQTDWTMFASRDGQKEDYAKQETLEKSNKKYCPEKWVA